MTGDTAVTADDVLAVVRDALVTVLEVEPAAVTRESRLVEDLHCDSLALVELAEIVEERLPVTVEDAALDDIRTVGDAVEYIRGRL